MSRKFRRYHNAGAAVAFSSSLAYAPFIRRWDINRLPYNGEADRWFDPAWLVAGGHRP